MLRGTKFMRTAMPSEVSKLPIRLGTPRRGCMEVSRFCSIAPMKINPKTGKPSSTGSNARSGTLEGSACTRGTSISSPTPSGLGMTFPCCHGRIHRHDARPHHPSCPLPGNERRELPAQAEAGLDANTRLNNPACSPWAHRPLPRAGRHPAARRARRPARGSLPWDYRDKLPPRPWCTFTPPRRYIFTPPLTNVICRSPSLWRYIRSVGNT